ncbi:hypothetical protein BpHYR1_000121 [Brachionus plicatilis]|uniref:Uncharacterized protein n=1 Tax=Brachionus plicatilis TaxID=10195 RepID=A0A3M7S8M0_BRAPC|nr:hypothetical protein BpHYR1_000121 [Brachionus plicatilis]
MGEKAFYKIYFLFIQIIILFHIAKLTIFIYPIYLLIALETRQIQHFSGNNQIEEFSKQAYTMFSLRAPMLSLRLPRSDLGIWDK